MIPLEMGSDIGGSIRVPAAFNGVYGHKPSYNLIPTRGHAPPGVDGAPVPIAVVGPMARSAADLQLALDVLAGPDADEAVGYRLDLPTARHARLGDYRVLILDQLPEAPLDSEVRGALTDLAGKLEALGATVIRKPDRLPDPAKAREVFGAILETAMSRGRPDAKPIDAHAWMAVLDGQLALRRQWAELFKDIDVVLAPVFPTVAFPHVDEPDWSKRTLTIDSKPVPYFSAMAWPAVPLVANLPATAAPIGFTRGGLPVAVQVIGPYLEDRTTIGFAGLLEREFGGFRAPPPL
jgi:amidase